MHALILRMFDLQQDDTIINERLVADFDDESAEGSIGLRTDETMIAGCDLSCALPFACCSSSSVAGQMQSQSTFAMYWL